MSDPPNFPLPPVGASVVPQPSPVVLPAVPPFLPIAFSAARAYTHIKTNHSDNFNFDSLVLEAEAARPAVFFNFMLFYHGE